ncbi:MAG TPA: hypothetical protein VGJ21_14570 [Terracidiphilus sp.]|jgi:hypothetical protein
MVKNGWIAVGALALTLGASMQAAGLETLHKSCSISVSENEGKFRLRIMDAGCNDDDNCRNFNDDSVSRLAGITLADLGREGAQITASLSAEAGKFVCAGTVHEDVLRGDATFTPDEGFVGRMRGMGFSGLDSEKLETYTLFDISTAWVDSLKKAGISGLSVDNLIALKIFRVDAAYVSGITSMGYETPDADKLVGLKVQGVNAEEVREIRGLGYKPTLDELVQIRIFHITPDFIKRMQSRGLHDLTISKLVQIKIFKLDE